MTGCGCGGAKCCLAAGDARHGRVAGYNRLGCRCIPCGTAKAKDAARYRSKNSQKIREYAAGYRLEHSEKERKRQARYRAANPEKVRERHARYNASPEGRALQRASSRRYRARKRNQSCGCCADSEGYAAIWALDGGRCAYCNAPATDIDHVVPLSKGGWDCVWNLRAACVRCNRHFKKDKSLNNFLNRLTALGIPIRPGATNSGLPCPAAAARMAARMLPASPRSPD